MNENKSKNKVTFQMVITTTGKSIGIALALMTIGLFVIPLVTAYAAAMFSVCKYIWSALTF